MCMALPTGTQCRPPHNGVQRLVRWIDCAAWLSAMVAVGLAKWLTYRLCAHSGRQNVVPAIADESFATTRPCKLPPATKPLAMPLALAPRRMRPG